MMSVDAYEALYRALSAKGAHLVNTPAAYKFCHYPPQVLPASLMLAWMSC
jgi:hypothetical protein